VSEIDRDLTIEEVAALVCATLDRHGVSVVLSGGSVVSIYASNEYASFDLDFIRTGLAVKVDAAMQELGFEKKRGRHWIHPRTDYWVEFPAGPVAVGDTLVREFAERRTPHGVLRLLAPTECVMDRLVNFFHNGDLECLDQAVAVARRQRKQVDLERIEAWSRGERAHEKFLEFRRRLGSR
jgi:hypothetical protein